MQLIRDRGQLFLDLQPAHDDAQWYSLSLVRRLLLGRQERSAVLDAGYARFLEEHLPEIEQRFAHDAWRETDRQLKELRTLRGQELFG